MTWETTGRQLLKTSSWLQAESARLLKGRLN